MKLSRLYSNDDTIFKPIKFNEGINFILSKDHSVGKTTLFKLIDYLLLKSNSELSNIIKKNELKISKDFYLCLELKLTNNKYLTIKRINKKNPNIEFRKDIESSDWIKNNKKGTDIFIPTKEKDALDFLNNTLNLTLSKKKINIRHYISYFLRDQNSHSDVFRINKFVKSKDKYYKPIITNLLGLNGHLIEKKYSLNEFIDKNNKIIMYIEKILKNETKDNIKGTIKELEAQYKKEKDLIDKFDFYKKEQDLNEEIINEIEKKVSEYNKLLNRNTSELRYVEQFLKESNFKLSIDELQSFFDEVQVYFDKNLKNNYESIINFNNMITKDRKKILKEQSERLKEEIEKINENLKNLNQDRVEKLKILENNKTMKKFKELQDSIVQIKENIIYNQQKLENFNVLENTKKEKLNCENQKKEIIEQIKNQLRNEEFENIKKNFSNIAKSILKQSVVFSADLNLKDNIEFKTKVVNAYKKENDEDKGNTNTKVLCLVFSLALAKFYQGKLFNFLAYDSVFDGDKKEYQNSILQEIEKISEEGVQCIFTSLDDEIKDKEVLDKIKKQYTIRYLTKENRLFEPHF